MNKEEQFLINRIQEMCNIVLYKGISLYTDFLNLNQVNFSLSYLRSFPSIKTIVYGGYNYAQRKVIAIVPDFYIINFKEFPIHCIKITVNNKNQFKLLNHRDFLGSIIGLGIDRAKIGDIIVKENESYMFYHSILTEFILHEFIQVKNISINTELIEDWSDIDMTPKYKIIEGTVSSIRLDAISSLGFSKSRTQIVPLIKSGKVLVNGKIQTSNSYIIKPNDFISIRGLGKIYFKDIKQKTKKGRFYLVIHRLI